VVHVFASSYFEWKAPVTSIHGLVQDFDITYNMEPYHYFRPPELMFGETRKLSEKHEMSISFQ
jgi:hypothetical protein